METQNLKQQKQNLTKLYVPAVTLSTKDNVKLRKQLEFSFKRKTDWNRYQPELKTFPQNRYLYSLIDPISQAVNRLFVLPIENKTDREVQTKYCLTNAEIKDYNVIIDGRNFFDQSIKND